LVVQDQGLLKTENRYFHHYISSSTSPHLSFSVPYLFDWRCLQR